MGIIHSVISRPTSAAASTLSLSFQYQEQFIRKNAEVYFDRFERFSCSHRFNHRCWFSETSSVKMLPHASEVSRNGVGVCECNEGYEENEEGTHCVEVAARKRREVTICEDDEVVADSNCECAEGSSV